MTAEDLLTRTFAEVTDAVDYPTTPMNTVVARSRKVRSDRRRRIAYVAAAAVVVTGGLSAGLLLRGGGGDSPPAPAGPLGKLPQGEAPKVAYLDGDTFVTTSGQRITSPAFADATAAVAWRKGVLVASAATSRHPFSVISFVSGGTSSRVGCGTPSFVVPADGGDPVYWLSDTCRYDGAGRLVQGSTSTLTSKGVTFTPVGMVADGIVGAASSSVLRLPSHAVVLPPGHRALVPLRLGLPRAATEVGGLVSGDARNFRQSAVVDATGAVQWRSPPSWTLWRFSPSGRYVAGTQSVGRQQPGVMGDFIGIFDAATGKQVLDQELPGLIIDGEAWEGESLLLVVEDRRGQEAIIRVGVDGTVTRTTPVVDGVPRPDAGRPPLATLRLAETP